MLVFIFNCLIMDLDCCLNSNVLSDGFLQFADRIQRTTNKMHCNATKQ